MSLKILWEIIFLLLLFITPSFGGGSLAYEIPLLRSEIRVFIDGSFLVTENFQVTIKKAKPIFLQRNFTGQKISNSQAKKNWQIQDVLRNGKKEKFSLFLKNSEISLSIGDKKTFLKPATYSYTVKYIVKNQVHLDSKYTFLKWTVDSYEKKIRIQKREIKIILPPQIPSDSIQVFFSTNKNATLMNPQGSENHFFSRSIRSNHYYINQNFPLKKEKNLTIFIYFNKNPFLSPKKKIEIKNKTSKQNKYPSFQLYFWRGVVLLGLLLFLAAYFYRKTTS